MKKDKKSPWAWVPTLYFAEGLPYVASPESMQRWLRQILDMEPAQLRRIGLAAMAAGFILCLVAQRSTLFD